MRYQVSEGLPPNARVPADPRQWLLAVARRSAAVPAEWARGITPRRAIVVAAVAGIALGAGVAGQTSTPPHGGYRDAIEIATGSADVPATVGAPTVPLTPAESSIAQLERPGYALPNATAASLNDVGATLSDVAALQQLQARILAPTAVGAGSLASLVQQAQISSALASASLMQPLDATAIEAAVAEVRVAEGGLL